MLHAAKRQRVRHAGERIYREACLPCHGPTGEGGAGGGTPLVGLTRDDVLAVVFDGRNNMPAFGTAYTEQELRDVAAFVADRLGAPRE